MLVPGIAARVPTHNCMNYALQTPDERYTAEALRDLSPLSPRGGEAARSAPRGASDPPMGAIPINE